MKRLSPRAIGGASSRTLLVVEDPERVVRQAVAARRDGVVACEKRTWLAARANHRPVPPRVGDRRASQRMAAELSRATNSAKTSDPFTRARSKRSPARPGGDAVSS